MIFWLILTLSTGITVPERVDSYPACQVRGYQAVQEGRAEKWECRIGFDEPRIETEI